MHVTSQKTPLTLPFIMSNAQNSYREYRAVSLVFQNIDPPPPSPPGECVLSPQQRRGVCTHRAVRGVGGQYFGRRDTGLASYSNNLSTRGAIALFICDENTCLNLV
jgi:hypothetical protein